MTDTAGPRALWWERAGTPAGPPRPDAPLRRRIATWVAAGAGLALFTGTVAAVQSTERSDGGALRTVPPELAAIAAGCTGIREWDVDPSETGVIQGGADVSIQVAYRTNPPSYGKYLAMTVPSKPVLYLPGEEFPIPERLVHNQRRGYVVVFYDTTVTNAESLRAVAAAVGNDSKVLIVPWSDTRPAFPDGAHVGIATWGVTQTCRMLDPDVVTAFRDAYPVGRAPEPRLP